MSDCASNSATQTPVIPYLSFKYDSKSARYLLFIITCLILVATAIIPDNFSDPVCGGRRGGRRETVPPDTITTVSIPPPTSSAPSCSGAQCPGGVVLFAAPVAASVIITTIAVLIIAAIMTIFYVHIGGGEGSACSSKDKNMKAIPLIILQVKYTSLLSMVL